MAAGHLTCPREYSLSVDPFVGVGRVVKEVALGRFGGDFDDSACYPTITAAIIPVGSHMATLFTEHKETILIAIGLFYFPELNNDHKEARERGKALCHRLDYSGTTYGFAVDFGLPSRSDEAGYKDPRRLNIQLPGEEVFNLQSFIDEKEAQTNWIAGQLPSMLDLIKTMTSRDKPAATLRALVHQEHESLHRRVKIGWAHRNGQFAFSNQHDGVGIGLDVEHDENEVAKALSAEVSATSGYQVRVVAKLLEHKRPQVTPYVWSVRQIGADQGDSFVSVSPTGLERTLQASFEEVWQERVPHASVSQEIIILGDHDMPNDDLLARASRTCTFQIREPGAQEAWESSLMRETRLMAERGQVWVGQPRETRNKSAIPSEIEQCHHPGLDIRADRAGLPSIMSNDDVETRSASSTPSECSSHSSPDDVETLSEATHSSCASDDEAEVWSEAAPISDIYVEGESAAPNPGSTIQSEHNDGDDDEMCTCSDAEPNVSPVGTCSTRPPPPARSIASLSWDG